MKKLVKNFRKQNIAKFPENMLERGYFIDRPTGATSLYRGASDLLKKSKDKAKPDSSNPF